VSHLHSVTLTAYNTNVTLSSVIANKPSDVCARRCSIRLPLVNDCDLLAVFSDFYLSLFYLTFSMRASPRTIGLIFSMEKLEWPGYNLVKVAWWSTQSLGHNTSTWQTHRSTDRQTDRQTDSHVAIANAAPTHCVGRQEWTSALSKHCSIHRMFSYSWIH